MVDSIKLLITNNKHKIILLYIPQGSSTGRRTISFAECSDRSKRRRTETLRSVHNVQELSVATSMSLRSAGNDHGAKLVKEITYNSPTRARTILKTWRKSHNTMQSAYTPEEALCFLISHNLTK